MKVQLKKKKIQCKPLKCQKATKINNLLDLQKKKPICSRRGMFSSFMHTHPCQTRWSLNSASTDGTAQGKGPQ